MSRVILIVLICQTSCTEILDLNDKRFELDATASSQSSTANSSSVASASTGSGGSGGSTTASSSVSTISTGGASSSDVTNSSSSSCMPTKTCASEMALCGLIDDGCGVLLDCGKYKRNNNCDATSGNTCACITGNAFVCLSNSSADETSPGPYGDCAYYQAGPTDTKVWCCSEGIVP